MPWQLGVVTRMAIVLPLLSIRLLRVFLSTRDDRRCWTEPTLKTSSSDHAEQLGASFFVINSLEFVFDVYFCKGSARRWVFNPEMSTSRAYIARRKLGQRHEGMVDVKG